MLSIPYVNRIRCHAEMFKDCAAVLLQDCVKDAFIVRLFDPVASPRCYAIIATKDCWILVRELRKKTNSAVAIIVMPILAAVPTASLKSYLFHIISYLHVPYFYKTWYLFIQNIRKSCYNDFYLEEWMDREMDGGRSCKFSVVAF